MAMRIAATTVLGLGLALGPAATASAQQGDGDAEMRAMTSSVLAGLRGTQEAETDPEAETGQDDLASLVSAAVAEGKSDAYLSALVEEAVTEGRVEVDPAMRTTEGKVDTETLLANLVQAAMGSPAEPGTETLVIAELPPRLEMVDEAEATAATEAEPEAAPAGPEIYVVEAGDSLGRIARKVYGDPGRYRAIFEANRDQLTSADRIVVGQRLVIPR